MSTEVPESAVSPPAEAGESSSAPSRRTFIATTGAVGSAVVAGGVIGGTHLLGPEKAAAADTSPSSRVSLTVNGTRRTVTVDNRTSLLDLLREHFDLTGSKKGCNAGATGRVVHPDPALWAHGVISPDRTEAVFALASMATPTTAHPGTL